MSAHLGASAERLATISGLGRVSSPDLDGRSGIPGKCCESVSIRDRSRVNVIVAERADREPVVEPYVEVGREDLRGIDGCHGSTRTAARRPPACRVSRMDPSAAPGCDLPAPRRRTDRQWPIDLHDPRWLAHAGRGARRDAPGGRLLRRPDRAPGRGRPPAGRAHPERGGLRVGRRGGGPVPVGGRVHGPPDTRWHPAPGGARDVPAGVRDPPRASRPV